MGILTPDDKEGEQLEACLYMCDCNQQLFGGFKKCMLLQMYLVERRRINKLYMKLFRKLLITAVLIYLIVCWGNMGYKVDHIKFRTDFNSM
jgi:hypothetical protein